MCKQCQCLMCLTSECHWVHSGSFKNCGVYLYTHIATPRHCPGKDGVWEHWIFQAIKMIFWSFAQNCLAYKGWNKDCILCCEVTRLVIWASCRVISHHLAKNMGSINGFPTTSIKETLIWMLAFNAFAKLSSSKMHHKLMSAWYSSYEHLSPGHCGRDDDLTSMICHTSLSFWIFFCWWAPRCLFCSEKIVGSQYSQILP